jgi:ketosteroid isomerase-like protein
MKADEVKQLINKTFTAFGEARWDQPEYVLQDMAEDGEWWVAGSTPLSGTLTKQQLMENLRRAGDIAAGGLQITPLSWVIEGDRVAVEAQSYMKLKDGREYKNSYHFAIQIRNGKIHRVKEYMDTAHVLDIFRT